MQVAYKGYTYTGQTCFCYIITPSTFVSGGGSNAHSSGFISALLGTCSLWTTVMPGFSTVCQDVVYTPATCTGVDGTPCLTEWVKKDCGSSGKYKCVVELMFFFFFIACARITSGCMGTNVTSCTNLNVASPLIWWVT